MRKDDRDKASSTQVAEAHTSAPAPMKRLTIDVTPELHKALKIQAVTDSITMADLIRQLLTEWLQATQASKPFER